MKREKPMDDLVNNNKKFIENMEKRMEGVNVACNKEKIYEMNEKWNIDYKKQGYKFMSREKIFNEVVKKINKKIIII